MHSWNGANEIVLVVQSMLGGAVFGALAGKIRANSKGGRKAKYVYYLFFLGGLYGFATGTLDDWIFQHWCPTNRYESVIFFIYKKYPIIESIYKPGHATNYFLLRVAWEMEYYGEYIIAWFIGTNHWGIHFEDWVGFSAELTHPVIKNTALWSGIGWSIIPLMGLLRKLWKKALKVKERV
ncbi:hypothetical protein ACFL02_10415 [Planctomycetota bacterium]